MDDGIDLEYSAPTTPISRPPYRPFWWLKPLAIGVVSLVVLSTLVVLTARYYYVATARNRTNEVITRLDRDDPGWRLEEIEAARKVIPDAKNSAIPLLEAHRLLPKDWPETRATVSTPDGPHSRPEAEKLTVDKLIELGAILQPDEGHIAEIRVEVNSLKPALAEARKVADLDEGRYKVAWALDPFKTLLPHAQNSRTIAKLLRLDAILRAHDGDFEGAAISCRALLNVARSIGDEPLLISQLVRIANQTEAIRTLEHVLTAGELSDGSLAAIQRLLEIETAESFLRPALRGERAALNDFYARVASGELDSLTNENEYRIIQWLWLEAMSTHARGVVLEEMTETIAIANARISGLRDAAANCEQGFSSRASASPLDKWSRLLLPAFSPFIDSYVMSKARFHATILAVAAERYRLKHGKWPESTDQLTPWPLAEIPTDPCIDEPLSWSRDEGSFVIYSIGPDLEDDGGALEQEHPSPEGANMKPRDEPYWLGKDFGIRLRVPAERRVRTPAGPDRTR